MPKAIQAIAAAAGILLLCATAASADPMRCSAQHQACASACTKLGSPAAIRVCITNCTQRRGACLRTGCWNDGTRTYCGLLKQ